MARIHVCDRCRVELEYSKILDVKNDLELCIKCWSDQLADEIIRKQVVTEMKEPETILPPLGYWNFFEDEVFLSGCKSQADILDRMYNLTPLPGERES